MTQPIRSEYKGGSEDLDPGNPLLGKVSILPLDTETFGFPVGVYQTATNQLDEQSREIIAQRLLSWADQNRILVCSCAVAPDHSLWKVFLAELGFHFVDLALTASLNGLQRAKLPVLRAPLRPAQPEDWDAIEAIAAYSFAHGRYHADPEFPRELANLRYRHWIRRALAGQSGSERVLVLGKPGSVRGFYHFVVEGTNADLRLVAVDKNIQGTGLGYSLCVSTLHALKEMSVHRVTTKISGGNTAVLNVYSSLGFLFSNPEVIYHWRRKQEAVD